MSFASSKGLGTCFTAWALPKLKDKVKTLLFLFQQGVASAELKSFAASETEVCGAKKAGKTGYLSDPVLQSGAVERQLQSSEEHR
jgi:hypothetical protein